MTPSPNQIYKHYKRGTTYRIVCIATIEATGGACVVYEALDPEVEQKIWVRPLEEFCDEVEYEGKSVSRFTLLSSS